MSSSLELITGVQHQLANLQKRIEMIRTETVFLQQNVLDLNENQPSPIDDCLKTVQDLMIKGVNEIKTIKNAFRQDFAAREEKKIPAKPELGKFEKMTISEMRRLAKEEWANEVPKELKKKSDIVDFMNKNWAGNNHHT